MRFITKTLALATLLATMASTSAFADGWRHGRHGNFYGPHTYISSNWVAPLVVGALAYEVFRPAPQPAVIYQYPTYQTQAPLAPIVVQPSVPYTVANQPFSNCSMWTETMHPDGSITKTRTCSN